MTVTRLYLLLLLSVGILHKSNAQFSSVRGLFEVDQIKGCRNLTVNINILNTATDCNSNDCNFDYQGDGMNDSQSDPFTFTYNDAGDNVYWLRILFPNNADAALEGFDSVRIEVLEKLPPTFDIWSCAGESIVVNITDTSYDAFDIDYGDGNSEIVMQGAPNPQHAYIGNTPRNLQILGFDNDAARNCPIATKTVNPLSTLPAGIINSLTAIDNESLVMTYTLVPDILYRLEIDPNSANSFNFLRNVSASVVTDTIRNLDLVNNYYCFRIQTIDPCINAVANSSNTVCSIQLGVSFDDNENNLTWSTENPDIDFTIQRDNMVLANVPPGNRNFTDTDIICNTDYCYQLTGNYNGAVVSTSLEVCGTSISTIPADPIDNISLQVVDNDIRVIWQAPTGNMISTYGVTRIADNSSLNLGTVSNTELTDQNLTTGLQSFCYEVSTSDQCGNNNNQSVQSCSMLLDGTIDNANNVSLSWNDFVGWSDGVANYTVEKTYPDNSVVNQQVNTTIFEEQELNDQFQTIRYRIIANPVDPTITPSISNVITLTKSVNLFNPNAFTPDGDRLNDTFLVKGRFIVSYEMKIFTRWGELVFSSTDQDAGWDGKREGRDLPQGTYAFRVRVVDMAGRELERLGSVVLLRN